MSLMSLTAVELGKKIKAKEVTVEAAVREALDAARAKEDQVHSFVTVDEEGALVRAKEVQAQIDAGELTGPLAGVPVAIKDNMCTEGLLTTCSSKILYNFIPTYTAEAVKKLEEAGAVIIGKTNMDEFAMGSTTETSAYGETKNPWNTAHVPGGSSGGSCAAVAAEECSFALGSDTGGSIRQPSSFCGVTGIKPTYGTVSRYGLIAYGSSLDQIGPVAKDVTDCATILEAITSYDKKDSTSVKREDTDFTSALVDDVKGMRIGIPKDYFGEGLNPEVKEAVLAAAKVLEEKGAIVEEFDLGLVKYAIPAYYVIACAEASSNLARFDGVKYGYRTKEYEELHLTKPGDHTRAYIKVQDGCNQFCTYCIIPYARGRVRSRQTKDVLEEVRDLAGNGYKEVVLTGIHLSSYGIDFDGQRHLLDLIKEVHKVEGIERIRLGSLEPGIITEEFAKELSEMPKVCPHFHLSLQSGCDATLKRMNRKYTSGEYYDRCQILRKYFDHPALTTDVIVGFPGETEEEFEASYAFVDRVDFYETHIFKYSKREGTKAAVMDGQIDEKIKGERSARMIALGERKKKAYEDSFIGKEVEVLFEERAQIEGKAVMTGHTKEYMKIALETEKNISNCIVKVRIENHSQIIR